MTEFILMLIAFFNLNVIPADLSDAEIADLEDQYHAAQVDKDTIRREIQIRR